VVTTLKTKVIIENNIHEETASRLYHGNISYYSRQTVLSFGVKV
jgi:hypothetical protein